MAIREKIFLSRSFLSFDDISHVVPFSANASGAASAVAVAPPGVAAVAAAAPAELIGSDIGAAVVGRQRGAELRAAIAIRRRRSDGSGCNICGE